MGRRVTSTRKRRPTTEDDRPPAIRIDEQLQRPTKPIPEGKSTHDLFLAADNIATLKKTDGEKGDSADVEAAAPPKEEVSKELEELFNLARDIFQVYFTTDDSGTDLSKMKQTKKKGILAKINGTMPYLTAYLKKLQLPKPVVDTILFTEASFRGIAQVRRYLLLSSWNNKLCSLLDQTQHFCCTTLLSGVLPKQSPIWTAHLDRHVRPIHSSGRAWHHCRRCWKSVSHNMLPLFVKILLTSTHYILLSHRAGMLMGFDKSFLSCGLFGYNSFLVGLALATFYSPEKHGDYYWPVAIGSIIFAYFSSVLFVMLGKILSPYKTPPFTLPFNISTIFFLLAMGGMNNVDMAPVRPPELPSYETEPVSALTAKAYFAGTIRGNVYVGRP